MQGDYKALCKQLCSLSVNCLLGCTEYALSGRLLYSILLYSTLLSYNLLYFTLLYFTLLYSTLLYFTLLYSTFLYFTLLSYTLLYFTLLYCTLNGSFLHWKILHSFPLHCIVPHCVNWTAQLFTTLHTTNLKTALHRAYYTTLVLKLKAVLHNPGRLRECSERCTALRSSAVHIGCCSQLV